MKDIKGYEGLYAITSCGKVWSYRSQRFLKSTIGGNGYLKVGLCKDGKMRTVNVHRLVAETYIPNPDNKPQVNHLDEDKTHNYVNNLAWATSKENCNYGTRIDRMRKKNLKAVYCVELNKVFESQVEAVNELKVNSSSLSMALNGKRSTAGGYHWRYLEEQG